MGNNHPFSHLAPTLAILVLLALTQARQAVAADLPGEDDTSRITVNFRDDGGVPKVNIEAELAKVGPGVNIPPPTAAEAEALDEISQAHSSAPNGKPIPRANWGAGGPLAIGSSDGKPGFLKILDDGGIAFIVNDKDGNPVVNIPPDSFLVADLQTGRLKKFLIEHTQDGTVSLAFSLLVDNSGSMSSVIPKVKEQASAFLQGMGGRALCQVTSFDTSRTSLTKGFVPCNAPTTVASIGNIKGNGPSTHLVKAIEGEMASLQTASADFKALVIISDGNETEGGNASEILAKKTSPIFSYWIGDAKEDTILRPISNAFFPDLSNGSDVLERMLKKVSASHRGITVLHVH